MSAKCTNAASPGPAESRRQETDGKSLQPEENTGQEKKAETQAEVVDQNSQSGRAKSDSSKDKVVGKRPLTLQDLIDFTNESP